MVTAVLTHISVPVREQPVDRIEPLKTGDADRFSQNELVNQAPEPKGVSASGTASNGMRMRIGTLSVHLPVTLDYIVPITKNQSTS
jgi:hypothetical protein